MTAECTLVIPAYNRGPLIGATLDSALAQTLAFREVIVVDDGSTDNTAEVLARYRDQITVVTTSNQGVQRARNVGIERARTELVALLDSDDLMLPGYLATMLPWMERHAEQDLVFCNFITFTHQGQDADKLSRSPFDFLAGAKMEDGFAFDIPDLYQRSVGYQPMFPSGLMLRRSFVERHGGYSPAFRGIVSEDWEFTLRAICLGCVAMCTHALVHIRKHNGNQSGDSVRMNLGEAQILEFSLANHGPVATANELTVRRSVMVRRLMALDSAYARGDFDLVHKVRALLRSEPLPAKARIKQGIALLPEPFRRWVWRCTQVPR